jgi:hypothetical protein
MTYLKRFLLLLACTYSCGFSLAQPSITATVHRPMPGDSTTRTYMNVGSFSPGPSGGGQTFNFAGANVTGTAEVGVFSADSTLAPWTYNLRADYDDGGLGYVEFFRSTSDSLAYSGFDKYIPDLTPVERHNPSIKFPYPFNYGGSFHDTYAGQHQSVGGPIPFTGTVDVEADAWGTLLLGADTIQNVLRIHAIDTMRDNFFGNIVIIAQECYEYYSDTAKFPVLSACTDPQNGGNYVVYSSLRNLAPLAVCDCDWAYTHLFPNPFVDELRISAALPGQLTLYDLQSRQLLSVSYEAGFTDLPMPKLAVGAYLAEIEDARGIERKLIQQE